MWLNAFISAKRNICHNRSKVLRMAGSPFVFDTGFVPTSRHLLIPPENYFFPPAAKRKRQNRASPCPRTRNRRVLGTPFAKHGARTAVRDRKSRGRVGPRPACVSHVPLPFTALFPEYGQNAY